MSTYIYSNKINQIDISSIFIVNLAGLIARIKNKLVILEAFLEFIIFLSSENIVKKTHFEYIKLNFNLLFIALVFEIFVIVLLIISE